MFPSGVVWPKMLCLMAGMVQMNSCSGMARLVLLMTVHFVLCFLPSLQARDARHHGQYGQEVWFAGFFRCSSRCVPFSVFRSKMPVFMAGMDHRTVWSSQVHFLDKVFYMPVVVLRVVFWSRQCSIGGSAVAVHHVRPLPVVMQRQILWSWLFR